MTALRKALLTTATAFLAICSASAQTNGSNSPYSRYGFGLLGDGGNAFNKGMAGTAYGMRDGEELNTKNPATYSAIDSLAFLFDFGLSLQNGNFSYNGTKTNAKNTSIDYITAGFRIAPRFGMSLGLIPYSTIGYETSTESTVQSGPGTVTQTNTFTGDGGLHEVYVGLGWAPLKPFSIGANVGYLWGDMTHTSSMSFDDTSVRGNTQTYYTDMRTYKVDFGAQFVVPINKKNSLTLGLTYGLGHDIKSDAYYYNYVTESSSAVAADTLTCPDAYQLPHTFGAGLTWTHNNSLRIGVDYTFQKWSTIKSPAITTDDYGTQSYVTQKGNFTDMHKISAGMEYVPDANSIRWRKRVRYRAGISFSTPYTKIDGRDGPNSFLASVGVALPITNRFNNRSLFNISAQYERVNPKVSGMITENYFRISLGITFNERWFMKWKAE